MFILFSLAETDNTWIFAAANNTDISLPENCTLIEEQSNETIKYGDYLRIRHSENGFFLHSHAIRYFHPQSSYQQQVTCFRRDEKTANKEACWWQILGAQGSDESELRGKIVDVSQPIRLRAQSVSNPEKDHNYIINKMMLHSHNYAEWQHPSPSREDDIERNQQEKKQEVTCYSDNDSNDNWIAYLELPTSSSLKLKSLFTLQHSECLGACADSPVLLVNDRTMCSFMSNDKLDQLVDGLKKAEGAA